MELEQWWPWYEQISSLLNLHKATDQLATTILDDLLLDRNLEPNFIKNIIYDKPVLVLGAGPSLVRNIKEIEEFKLFQKFVTIIADGAVSALIKILKIIPEIIVSDLDGNFQDLLFANERGSIMIIHAHGDNIQQLLEYVTKLTNVFGTTQVKPTKRVHNFGGFTDGDRAVFLAIEMGAKTVSIAGMDLGEIIGEYSKSNIISLKRKKLKLKICKYLLEWLASRTEINLYNLTCDGEKINGFEDVSPRKMASLI